ncbi:MAG: hypothetical protein IJW48_01595 [Clostridia bacterium]|nr:hypothetical protein [Clostridia bacterium]
MSFAVFTKTMGAPRINESELLRYAVTSATNEVMKLVKTVTERYSDIFTYRVTYTELDVRTKGYNVDLGVFSCTSRTLAAALSGCDKVYLLAATVGGAVDRMTSALAITSPAAAHILDSFGTERVESLLDDFSAFLEEDTGCTLRPRVSAGYGDIPLELQKDIFKALSPESRIGLYLNNSLLMTPMKSVTAFIGVKKEQ